MQKQKPIKITLVLVYSLPSCRKKLSQIKEEKLTDNVSVNMSSRVLEEVERGYYLILSCHKILLGDFYSHCHYRH